MPGVAVPHFYVCSILPVCFETSCDCAFRMWSFFQLVPMGHRIRIPVKSLFCCWINFISWFSYLAKDCAKPSVPPCRCSSQAELILSLFLFLCALCSFRVVSLGTCCQGFGIFLCWSVVRIDLSCVLSLRCFHLSFAHHLAGTSSKNEQRDGRCCIVTSTSLQPIAYNLVGA